MSTVLFSLVSTGRCCGRAQQCELEVKGQGSVGVSHQAPERPLLGGNNSGSAGGVVHQCQLPEAAFVVILPHTRPYAINQYHYVIDSSERKEREEERNKKREKNRGERVERDKREIKNGLIILENSNMRYLETMQNTLHLQ